MTNENQFLSASDLHDDASRILEQLLGYCRSRAWAGYDPYDALNSPLASLPLLDTRIGRLALTQILKRSPINVRPLFLVPKTQNAKALALFLSAVLKRTDAASTFEAKGLVDRLAAARSPGTAYWCWGYSFPWQTRTILVPRQSPNLVCTVFAATALLDAYERFGERRLLQMAVSASEYLVEELFWSDGSSSGFSYPLPSYRSNIHNAHFLGAALLCRVSRLTGDARFVAPALAVARWSAAQQRADGSWPYGSEPAHQWIDNFHTGYNLCALHSMSRDLATREFDVHLRRGLRFYIDRFFTADGAPGYFHDRTYPIDIHCVAQSIITLVTLQQLAPEALRTAHHVARWAIRHMWDRSGFFYYRVLRSTVIKTPYMRWSQAWMVLALATLLADQVAASALNARTAS